jgi:hypothetical protein
MPPRDNTEQDMPVASTQVPRATLQALNQLTRQIESLNDYLVAQRSPTAQGQIQGELQQVASRQRAAQVAPTMPPNLGGGGTTTGGVVLPGGVVGPPPPAPPPARPYLPEPSEVSFRNRLKEGKKRAGEEGGGNAFNRFSEGFLEPKTRSQRPTATPPPPVPNEGPGGNSEAIPPNAMPPNASGVTQSGSSRTPSGVIPGMSQQEVSKLQREGFEIPQFGEWQLDTKLKMARDWIGQYATNKGAYDEEGNWQWGGSIDEHGNFQAGSGKSTAGQTAATVSGYLNYAASHAAQIHAIRRSFDRVMNFGSGMQQTGEQLGYSPQSGLGPSSIFGFRNPLAPYTSEAGQQGAGIRWDAEKMTRLGTGITSAQAKEIYGSLAGMGFSNQQHDALGLTTGGDLENIATQLVAPMVKNTGMSPEVASQFANALRNGNTSIKELSKTLTNLPEAAHTAREGINEYTESLQGFAEQAEQMGATKQQGYQSGMAFTQSTGLDPRLLGQMQQSPFFQGLALTQMGVLPSGIGALPGGSQVGLTMQAMKMAMNATQGLNQNKYQTIGGKRVLVQSGSQAQQDQAAQLLGMSPEEFQRLYRNQGQNTASANALTLLQADTAQGWKNELAGAMQKSHGNLTKEQREKLQKGGEGITGWNQISQQLLNAGISKKEVGRIGSEGFDKRASDVENLLAKLNKQSISEEGQNKVQVQFTGAAAKFFQQVPISPAKAASNAGGQSITSLATSPITQALTSMTPLGPLTQLGGLASDIGGIL